MLLLSLFFLVLLLVLGSPCLLLFSFSPFGSVLFCIDNYSLLFALVLSSIAWSVLLWSYYYLDIVVHYKRFLGLVLSFLCSMFILIFSSDLLTIFVGWDLLGFTSFFLVSYYGNSRASAAALLTSLTNRVGDCIFFLVLGLSWCYSGVLSFSFVLLLVLIGMTKSAQVPFSSWLPAAIYAPTPVSALVHSSTLVTAGVFLVLRFVGWGNFFLVYIGVLTSCLAGYSACLEFDSKKVIALSTLSQLGIIVTGLGLGLRSLVFSHLLSHAVFKALLFLCVGCFIHTHYGSQELRQGQKLVSGSCFGFVTFTVSLLSLGGLCFSSGFFTKDGLLEAGYSSVWGLLPLLLFYLSLGLTISYITRLWLGVYSAFASSAGPIPSLSTPLLIKVPTSILLVTIFWQSIFYLHCQPLFLSSLGLEDKLVLFLVLVLGWGLGYVLTSLAIPCQTTLDWLGNLVSLSALGLCGSSSIICLDTKNITAFGAGSTWSVAASLVSNPLLSSNLLVSVALIFILAS